MRYYSKTTGSTYLDSLHSVMPDDVVPISEARYLEVFANPPLEKVRGHDEDGMPVLLDPPAWTPEEIATVERAWRDSQIRQVQWLRDRHRDQLDMNQAPTLTTAQFSELLAYIRDLRDWPQSPAFPSPEHRPAVPVWIDSPIR